MARTWEQQMNLLNGADANFTERAIMESTASWNDKKAMMDILTSDNREEAYLYGADTAVREMLMDCIEEANKRKGNGKTVDYYTYSEAVRVLKEKLEATERSLFNEGEGYFHSRVDFYSTGFGEEAIQMGINVCASGTINPDTAMAWSELFRVAGNLAANFPYNGYTIEYGRN